MNTTPISTVLISAAVPGLAVDELQCRELVLEVRLLRLIAEMPGAYVDRGIGLADGVLENLFLVTLPMSIMDASQAVAPLAKWFEQEYIVVMSNGYGYKVQCNKPEHQPLGFEYLGEVFNLEDQDTPGYVIEHASKAFFKSEMTGGTYTICNMALRNMEEVQTSYPTAGLKTRSGDIEAAAQAARNYNPGCCRFCDN